MSRPQNYPPRSKGEKACTKCGEVKPLTSFSTDKRHLDGRQSQCMTCTKQRQARYKQLYPDRLKASKAADYRKHRAKRTATQARWVAANKERIQASYRVYIRTPEGRRRSADASRKYREANPEVCAARVTRWNKANPQKVLDSVHRYMVAHIPTRIRA